MGMFKRANEAERAGQAGERADLSPLLLQGEDTIEQLGRAHMSWGLGSADRWDLDGRTGKQSALMRRVMGLGYHPGRRGHAPLGKSSR
jgi:hypothetical protein